MVLLHIDLSAKPTINLGMIYGTNEQDYPSSYCGTMLSFTDGDYVEEVILLLFGFFHQIWMTTCLLLIPRFNSRDMSWLSSVMVHRYLSTTQLFPTSSAYARQTVGRATCGVSTGMEHKGP
jgi:hypothetical protein